MKHLAKLLATLLTHREIKPSKVDAKSRGYGVFKGFFKNRHRFSATLPRVMLGTLDFLENSLNLSSLILSFN